MVAFYIKSFIRSLRKNLFFYSINLAGFVIGFLVITLIFIYIDQELSFDRFNKNSSGIYRLHPVEYGVTPKCFAGKLRNQIPEITGIARFISSGLTVSENDREFNLGTVYHTDPDVFRIFSFNLLTGDPSTVLNAPYSIVLDKSTARKIFGNDSPSGKTLKSRDGTTFTVTGVMDDIPYCSHIRGSAFISFETLVRQDEKEASDCSTWSTLTYVSLSAGSDSRVAEKKINTLLDEYLMRQGDNKIPLILEPLLKIYFNGGNNKYDGCRHGNLQIIAIYIAISVMILLNVIINYTNLSTAVAGSRVKEIAVRKINGAERIHLIRQEMIEALGVAVISYLIAILLIGALLPRLSELLNIPISESAPLARIYITGFAGIVLTGVLTGLFPGIYISNISPISALRDETIFRTRGIQRRLMLISQLFIASLLLNSTLIINRQMNYILHKDLGFNQDKVVCFTLDRVLAERKALLKENLLKVPGIKGVSFSAELIGEGFGKGPVKIGETEKLCYLCTIDPDYLELYGMQIKTGRNFSHDLATDFTGSCLVNEAACRAFGIDNPVGESTRNRLIIGVVRDFNFSSLYNEIEPLVIKCGEGNTAQVKLSGNDSQETMNTMRKICDEISPDKGRDFSFLATRFRQLYKAETDLKESFMIFSIIALVVALLGLFGLTMFLLGKRTREIGVRKLFGATLVDLYKMLAAEQLLIVLISNVLAVPVSYLLMNGWLNNFAYRAGIGSFIFLKTFLIIGIITLLAVALLVIRSFRAKLTETLRYQ